MSFSAALRVVAVGAALATAACTTSDGPEPYTPPPHPSAAFTNIPYAAWTNAEPPYRLYPGDEVDLAVTSAPAGPGNVAGSRPAQEVPLSIQPDEVQPGEEEEQLPPVGHVRVVYLGPVATREHAKIHLVIRALFDHYCAHPDEIPGARPEADPGSTPADLATRVSDWIAGMTDRYCIHAFEQLCVPVAFAP